MNHLRLLRRESAKIQFCVYKGITRANRTFLQEGMDVPPVVMFCSRGLEPRHCMQQFLSQEQQVSLKIYELLKN